ncbi:asparaginase [Kitasatospora kifunensis]|uniref:L-asparaginase n=1 Tax=Kitasatospora kifunensis TaxID=58351 RepID=A0A7W7RBF3_KITKI|nr:asparaginase [Kitasatospora kifunensis]MBB4928864.1 L-asparaginase [Kitasatospora kifunensis]
MPSDAPLPTVLVVTLGGTIAMTSGPGAGGGVVPRLTAADLVSAVPGLDRWARVDVLDFRQKPGASLLIDDIAELAQLLNERAANGIDGFVITQGTDTLEETAFLLDLLYTGRAPVVVTGAMRNPSLAGADGPANVLAAVQTAASPEAAGLGCVVVFADTVHAAHLVRKVHSTSIAAFASPNAGPLGYLAEGRLRLLLTSRRGALPVGLPLTNDAKVALIPASLGDDGTLLDGLESRFAGVVVSAFGAGHLPASWVEPLERLAAVVPVVLASRTGAGPVLTETYAFPGSEKDLLSRGLISAGHLDPLKARLLLLTHLRAGADRAAVAAAFQQF